MPGAEVERTVTRGRSIGRGAVRMWGEVGVTLAVTDQPPQFVKVSFGHERIAPNDTQATLDRYERIIDEFNEKVVERRVRKYKRMIQREGV